MYSEYNRTALAAVMWCASLDFIITFLNNTYSSFVLWNINEAALPAVSF
jgi:hypothetical protein